MNRLKQRIQGFVWVSYLEVASAVCLGIFAFLLVSSILPTGFVSLFSTLAFLFAVPAVFCQFRFELLTLYEKVGLILLLWLGVTMLWSHGDVSERFTALGEYRIFFLVPLVATVFRASPSYVRYVLSAIIFGACVALVGSYGLAFDIIPSVNQKLSFANRIFHGFVMSHFYLFLLLVARDAKGWIRIFAMFLALATAYNVLNVEIGRTGYIQVLAVTVFFFLVSVPTRYSILVCLLAILGPLFMYGILDSFHDRIIMTIDNVHRAIVYGDIESSAGYRIEFYRAALVLGLQNPIVGVGVGDVAGSLSALFDQGTMKIFTDNLHNEFLNMWVAGGIVAALLFAGFVLSIGIVGYQLRGIDRLKGDLLLGACFLLLISALFNSTIKDYGEKHALILMLSILSVYVKPKKLIN